MLVPLVAVVDPDAAAVAGTHDVEVHVDARGARDAGGVRRGIPSQIHATSM
jgi:hypothetical protein